MDDQAAFERQLTVVLEQMAGPEPRFDAMAIVRAAQARRPTRRIPSMFHAVKLVAAGAAIALSGWFVIAAVRVQSDGEAGPVEIVASPSPSASPVAVAMDPCATPLVRVTGTILWGGPEGAAERVVTETGDHLLGFGYWSSLVMSDKRLDGRTVGGGDWYRAGDAGVTHGTRTIENAAGRWEGPSTLSGTEEDGFVWMDDLVGSGAYLGLSALLFGSSDQSIQGTIYPTDIADCDFVAVQ